MTDLVLASLHHLLVFALYSIFAAEMVLVRPGLDAEGVKRVARLDGLYGGIAMAVLIVGFSRAVFGLKGWEYYGAYWVFWAKIATFVAVGLLSIPPTLRFTRWRKAAAADAAYRVPEGELATVRPWLGRQGIGLLLIPILAAMMARGVGY